LVILRNTAQGRKARSEPLLVAGRSRLVTKRRDIAWFCGASKIARHPRVYGRGQFVFDQKHYLALPARSIKRLPCRTGHCRSRSSICGGSLKGGWEINRGKREFVHCAFAMAHSRGGIFHSFCAKFNTRKRSFSALSSVGKWPRARTALRNLAFNESIAFVV